jgi:hypothetical protein
MNYLENVNAAIEAWQSVPKTEVRLSTWSRECGSTHCFGGWLPYFEHFQGLGVVRNRMSGAPEMLIDGKLWAGYPVAARLFGDMDLFDPRLDSERHDRTDWQVVMDRLVKRKKELEHELP